VDRDDFIINVYCLVCEYYNEFKNRYLLRQGGFKPALSDEEVICIEICGEYFKHSTDKDIFEYFKRHYSHFFPQLRERTIFVRQAANLWQVKVFIQQALVKSSGQADDDIQIIDTMPLPVCKYIRSHRDRCFETEAD